ncbi:methylenetetrahydrofolate reductase [Helicobacter cappadocius]|uniref:Methylenetetrahydrofolate reductase n=1 Tax=Helicobacter cappadocius TaxID=3063998 RepID=A0AA90Q2T8_9HELI|nr:MULTISPECIES: methylenetetrahydrofolate reductase [unclassified Helicobacter]MDO7253174.1 methylenetetrahydrofolate reductase [Helicobacter sp. faydin-H75]MDP2539098.1 methylenetetrahydrofolate reductase [Helicobacter sp. faydin-H76]
MIGLEYIPKQKDTDIKIISKWIDKIKPDFIILPDSPNLKPTPEASVLAPLWSKELKLDVIASIAGSGRREERVESLLKSLAYLQVKKVALIGGDCPIEGNLSGIQMIKKAKEILGQECVVISGSKAMLDTQEKVKLQAKIENGANIIITQPIFELKTAQKFLDDFEKISQGSKAKAMINFFPIYESGFCERLMQNNLGFEIPMSYLQNIRDNPIKANLKLYEAFVSLGENIHISGAKNIFLQEFFDNLS